MDANGLVKTATEMKSYADITTAVVDLSDVKSIDAAPDMEFDVIINNAGVVSGNKFISDVSPAAVGRTFAVNVVSHIHLLRRCLPKMLAKNEGHICTIASAAGLVGAPRMADYSASKVGVGMRAFGHASACI